MSAANGSTYTGAELSTDATRFASVTRPYSAADVQRLRGSVLVEQTLARLGAEKLWRTLHSEPYVNSLGALSGNQASTAPRRPRVAARVALHRARASPCGLRRLPAWAAELTAPAPRYVLRTPGPAPCPAWP
jgi:hypothetical protein